MRDTGLTLRQNWWLLAAAAAALLPISFHLPIWLPLTAAAAMVWRAWLTWHVRPLPHRWWLVAAVGIACLAIWREYHLLFGRQPGIAMLVIFLALKLLELRQPRDGMTVILLGNFLILSSFLYSQTLPATLLCVGALVVVQACLVAMQPGCAANWRTPLKWSGKLLLQAVPVALLFFVLFPRIQGPLWSLPQDANAGLTGLSDTMNPGAFSRLVQSDAIAFRVKFNDPVPRLETLYWRAQVLTDFDGSTWRMRPRRERDRLPEQPQGRRIDYTLIIEPHQQRWLFMLEQLGTLPAGTRFNDDRLLLAAEQVRTRAQYALTAYPDWRPVAEESASVLQVARALPPQGNPRTRAIAQTWRAQAKSDAEIVALAQQFFQRQGLAYTLTPPLMPEDSIDAFLFDARRGFCEHFSAAFVFALRAAGVPARVVGGYQGGELNPVDGYLTIRQYDAHAWAEVWLSGQGWVRVDPTVVSSPTRISDGITAAFPESAALPLLARNPPQWLRDLRFQWDSLNSRWHRDVIGFNTQRQREFLQSLGMAMPDAYQLGIGLCAGLVLLLGAYTWLIRARPQPQDPAAKLWARFIKTLQKSGVPIAPWMGPDTVCAIACGKLPQNAATIQDIVRTYIGLRYQATQTHDALSQLRQAISRFKASP